MDIGDYCADLHVGMKDGQRAPILDQTKFDTIKYRGAILPVTWSALDSNDLNLDQVMRHVLFL